MKLRFELIEDIDSNDIEIDGFKSLPKKVKRDHLIDLLYVKVMERIDNILNNENGIEPYIKKMS